MRREWTSAELSVLGNGIIPHEVKRVAARLGRSYKSVYNFADRQGLLERNIACLSTRYRYRATSPATRS